MIQSVKKLKGDDTGCFINSTVFNGDAHVYLTL